MIGYKHGDIERGPGWELRCGRWQDVLADVEPDHVITDPPYSERTHAGALDATTLERGVSGYAHWAPAQVVEFLGRWGRCQGWVVVHSDDVLGPEWRAEAERRRVGRYAFPMLPVLQQQPRTRGDGPAPHGHYLLVSRARSARMAAWGSLPGWYVSGRDGSIVRGGKPLSLMRAIVRDYSRPGDLVCDPCAGGATTLLAACLEGRRAIGAEMDPETFSKAVKRLREHESRFQAQPPGCDKPPRMRQQGLDFGGDE